MKELLTKNLDVKDKFNFELHKKVDSCESTFLSRPISLRFWSSFFVILPIFIQAPWVRLEPISALCFTFVILLGAFILHQKATNKWFILSSLLIGVSEDKDSKNYIKKGIKGDFEWMEYGEQDPKWLKRMGPLTAAWEDYQKVLRKEIMDRIGRTYFNSCIVINFEDIGFGKENPVARIDIEPAPQPASDRSGNRHIRFANGTQLLPSDQENEYFKNRFPNLENIERDVNKL